MKKAAAILLAVLMLTALLVPSVSALEPSGETGVGYNRYYFLAPDDWFNEHTDKVGIYWWNGSETPESWPGYEAKKADAENVYYYDVPNDVTNIIWNNFIDADTSADPLYEFSQQTVNIGSEYYDKGECELYPDGTDSFNEMIYVIDPDWREKNQTMLENGNPWGYWYYYYGNGEYGTEVPNNNEVEYKRYYFLVPDDWFNEYTDKIGIYWWEGTEACQSWPGYEAHKADVDNVYYYDVPADVCMIIWNNFVVAEDYSDPMFEYAKQTAGSQCEYYDPGEVELYPDGVPSFDGMIYVITPDWYDPNIMISNPMPWGYWYYYYGNGEYGTEITASTESKTNRLYFLMPDEWYNEYTDTAGIYWWEGTDAQASWPGVKANKGDAENVYYYDVPNDVTSFYWNNYITYPTDLALTDHYYKTCKAEIQMDSLQEYDGMIFVVDPSLTIDREASGKVYGGYWYKYLGKGEYEIDWTLGDVDKNGTLNIKDATTVQKYTAGIVTLSETALSFADFDASGDVNVKDATAIQKHIVGNEG